MAMRPPGRPSPASRSSERWALITRQHLLLGLLLLVSGHQALQWWQLRAVQQPVGVLAAEEPRQQPITAAAFVHGDYRLEPRASYQLTARVLGRKPYRWGREAELSPLDFALGWGVMSDNRVIEALDISQSGRFFWLRWQAEPPAPEPLLLGSAANVHLVPANEAVARQLAKIRPGQVVELQGLLVDASATDGWQWRTSLTRSDTGAGACELFWVERVQVLLRGR